MKGGRVEGREGQMEKNESRGKGEEGRGEEGRGEDGRGFLVKSQKSLQAHSGSL